MGELHQAEKPLTAKQALVATILADPTVLSVSEASRRAGIDRRTIQLAAKNPAVQELRGRIVAARGDTARSLRGKALQKAHGLVEGVKDCLEATQIALGAAKIEETLGESESDPCVPRGTQVLLAYRLLSAYLSGTQAPPECAERARQQVQRMREELGMRPVVIDAEVVSSSDDVDSPKEPGGEGPGGAP